MHSRGLIKILTLTLFPSPRIREGKLRVNFAPILQRDIFVEYREDETSWRIFKKFVKKTIIFEIIV